VTPQVWLDRAGRYYCKGVPTLRHSRVKRMDFVSKTTNIDSRLMSTRANAVVGSFARVLEDHDLDEEEKW